MRERVRASLVQFAPEWLERDRNAERMAAYVRQEAEQGSDLVVFPELANLGYVTPLTIGELPAYDGTVSANDFALRYIQASEPVPGPTTILLAEVARRHGTHVVVGISELHPAIPGTLYNSAVLIGPSAIIGVHRKVHIPLNERFYFYAGNRMDVFQTDLGNICMTVCYDGRFPEICRIMALQGGEIHCAIWATPVAPVTTNVETHKYRSHIRAQENGNYFLSCSLAGREGNVTFLGHSAAAAPGGEIIGYLDTDEEAALRVEMSAEKLLRFRASLGVFRDRRPELYSPITAPLDEPFGLGRLSAPARATGEEAQVRLAPEQRALTERRVRTEPA